MRTTPSWLAALSIASCVALAFVAPPAQAQDDAPPIPPADAPPADAPPAGAAPVTAPSAPVAGADTPAAPSATPPAPAPPDSAAPSAVPDGSSAAFAPLPGAPPEPNPSKPPHTTRLTRPSEPAPPLDTATPAQAADTPYHPRAPSSPNAPPEAEKSSDDEGVFGPFRIGFLIGTGLPDLLNLGGQIKLTRYFGAGVNVGIIPTVKISFYGQAKLAYQEYDAYGHIYPFGGAFFLGAGVGYATMHASLASSYPIPAPLNVAYGNSAAVDSDGSVRTLVLTPQIGLLKTFGPGFSIGLDVGAQVPIAASKIDSSTHVSSNIPQALLQQSQVQSYDDKVRSTLTTAGRQILPTFNFKIGWLL